MPKQEFDFQETTPEVPRSKSDNGLPGPPDIDMSKPNFPKEFEYPSPQSEPTCGCGDKD